LGAAVRLAVTGGRKAVRPIADLAAMMVWPGRVPVGLVRFLGIAKMLGAIQPDPAGAVGLRHLASLVA